MKKVKTDIELLIILRDFIVQDNDFYGMCGSAWDLVSLRVINEHEYSILADYINERQPSPSKFWKYGYWWKIHNKKPRLRWIDKELKKLKLKLEENGF